MRRPRPVILFALLATVGACAHRRAPLSGAIVTDRPDFTESTSIVPTGHAQVETGHTTATESDEHVVTTGEVLYRHGLSSRTELRLALNSFARTKTAGGELRGFEDAGIGVKVALWDQPASAPWLPTTSVIVASSLPTGARGYRARTLQPEIKLLLDWEVTERFGLGSNLNAYSVAGAFGGRVAEYAASLVAGYDLTARFGIYGEYIGHVAPAVTGGRQHWASGGLSYLVTPNLQLDLRGGRLVRDAHLMRDNFFGVGVSTRW